MKKTPLLIIIISSTILFTLLGAALWHYDLAGEDLKLSKTPFLAALFIHPHRIFEAVPEGGGDRVMGLLESGEAVKEYISVEEPTDTPLPTPAPTAAPTVSPTSAPSPTPTPEFKEGRYEPLRESTREEYLNHISADIYGDDGVKRAAKYEFREVPIEYFDDALFIGDSRTVGLSKYTDLSEHATFLCETSLTAEKVFKSNYKGKGQLADYLTDYEYGKIYLMVGINELGTGTTEYFMEKYTGVVDTIHEYQPDALIFIQAVMNVDKEKNDTDPIYNNSNITGRNHAIATLADNETFFYIDVNEAVCDEEGNLSGELTFDHLHLVGSANELWKEFLMKHGVVRDDKEEETQEINP